MRTLYSFILLGLLISCTNQEQKSSNNTSSKPIDNMETIDLNGEKNNPISYLHHGGKITLSQTNAKCGEWGGDKNTITFYKKEDSEDILVEYTKLIRDCSDHKVRLFTKYNHNPLIATHAILEKMGTSISDLDTHKSHHIHHAGNSNSVVFEDSSLLITDFSFYLWPSFQILEDMFENKQK